MYYIIPAGSLPPAYAEESQRHSPAAALPQNSLGLDAAGNHVLYLAPADQTPAQVLTTDASILQPQLLSAQDAPLVFSAAPEQHLNEPVSGPMAANIDAWVEPGCLSAPAAFPTAEQRLGSGSAAPPLSLAFESIPQHAKQLQQSLAAPPPPATQDTAFLMQQLQQLQHRQQQQQQQQQQAARQALLVQQQQQHLQVMPAQEQQAPKAGLGQAWNLGQPGLNSSTQVQRLLSSIAQNNNNRRANPLGKMPTTGGARAGQLGQMNSMHPLNRPGPVSAPTKPLQAAAKPPHGPPLRGHPSWAGQGWNPRLVGASTLGSTGTGVFLPNLLQENKAAPAQLPAPATSAAPPLVPGEALAMAGPPSIASPINSNASGSAWSANLSSNPSVYVEDP